MSSLAAQCRAASLEAFRQARAMGTGTNAGGGALSVGVDCGRQDGGKFGPGNDCASYQGNHKPPSEESGAPAHDLTKLLPEDIYSKDAGRLYGHGDRKLDEKTASIIRGLKGNPESPVRIFRAVPKKAGDAINGGDWVTVNEDYAKQHGESTLGGDYKVVSKAVKAKDIFNNGDSIHEWGYRPAGRSLDTRYASLLAFAEARDCGKDEDGKFSKGNTCASGIAVDVAKGAAKGGVLGAAAGLAKTVTPHGAATHAAVGAVIGALKGLRDNQLRPTRVAQRIEKLGMTEDGVGNMVVKLGGSPKSVASLGKTGKNSLTIKVKDERGKVTHTLDVTRRQVVIYPHGKNKEMTDKQVEAIKKIAAANFPKQTTVKVRTDSASYLRRLAKNGFSVAAGNAGEFLATVLVASHAGLAGEAVLSVSDFAFDTTFTDSLAKKGSVSAKRR